MTTETAYKVGDIITIEKLEEIEKGNAELHNHITRPWRNWSLMWVDFLQNAINIHDKATPNGTKDGERGWTCDERNELQSWIEMWLWENVPPAVGERYGGYVDKAGDNITTWTGFKIMRIYYIGPSWIAHSVHVRNRRRMVYAVDSRGFRYRGIWSYDGMDLIGMKRVK